MENLGSSFKVSDEGLVVGTTHLLRLSVEHCELDKTKPSACLRLRAKSIRCYCRIDFAAERHPAKGFPVEST